MKYLLVGLTILFVLGCSAIPKKAPYQKGTIYMHEQFISIECQETEPCQEGETKGPLSCRLVK